jgi:hypothetical protein
MVDKQTREKRSPEGARGGQHLPGRARGVWRCQGVLLPMVAFLAISYFSNFSKIPRLTKIIFTEF